MSVPNVSTPHDRMVMASLKHGRGDDVPPESGSAPHDRMVMASLKRPSPVDGVGGDEAPHDRMVMASLKLVGEVCEGAPVAVAPHDRMVMASLKHGRVVAHTRPAGDLPMTEWSWPH